MPLVRLFPKVAEYSNLGLLIRNPIGVDATAFGLRVSVGTIIPKAAEYRNLGL
jgi:hypothetical protein